VKDRAKWADVLAHNRRSQVLSLTLAALSMIGLATSCPTSPKLVWNATASAPVGLYALTLQSPRRGDFVLVQTPITVHELAAKRGYIPANVPMVKRIAAALGDTVCASGNRVFINHVLAATRRARDGAKRPLPAWQGCRRLGTYDVFLLTSAAASFDGRYFGITPRSSIIGRLEPLWTD